MEINKDDYMNLNDAMQRLGGNEKLYKRLLMQFIAGEYTALADTIAQSGDIQEVKAHVHTIKGVASNLSLDKVHHICAEIEEKIHNGQEYADDMVELKPAIEVTTQLILEYTKE